LRLLDIENVTLDVVVSQCDVVLFPSEGSCLGESRWGLEGRRVSCNMLSFHSYARFVLSCWGLCAQAFRRRRQVKCPIQTPCALVFSHRHAVCSKTRLSCSSLAIVPASLAQVALPSCLRAACRSSSIVFFPLRRFVCGWGLPLHELPPRRARTRCSVAPPSRAYSSAVLSSALCGRDGLVYVSCEVL
jgi:hypothetical protein